MAFFGKLEAVLDDVAEREILLLGDFNAKLHEWFSGDATTSNGNALKDLMDRFDMCQLCSKPTHLNNAGEPISLLDLAFTNVPSLFNSAKVSQPISSSDHLPVILNTSLAGQFNPPVIRDYKKWLYLKKNNYRMAEAFLFDDWTHVFQPNKT